MLYLKVHEFDDNTRLVSLDFSRHMENLPRQHDILELIETPRVDPCPPPPSPVYDTWSKSTEQNESCNFTPSPRTSYTHHSVLTDIFIWKYVEVKGPHWRQLSKSLGGRSYGYSDDVVRNRYIRMCSAMGRPYHSIHPRSRVRSIRRTDKPCSRWTEEDDDVIRDGVGTMGFDWSRISLKFRGKRTIQAVRTRASRLGFKD